MKYDMQIMCAIAAWFVECGEVYLGPREREIVRILANAGWLEEVNGDIVYTRAAERWVEKYGDSCE